MPSNPDRVRPTRHRLHLAPELDDLGVYVWSVPLDPGDTLTIEDGRRFTVITMVEIEPGFAIDRLLEVEPDLERQGADDA